MKTLKENHVLFAVIAASALICSCGKSSVKPKQTTITTTTYTVSTFAGSGNQGSADGIGTAASFFYLTGLAFASDGTLYVGDWANCEIRKVNISTAAVTTYTGNPSGGFVNGPVSSALFYGSANIAFDKSGNLFVADEENNAIREITPAGTVSTLAGSATAGFKDGNGTAAMFNHPEGLVADASGDIYVVDGNNHAVRKIVIATGVVTTIAGNGTSGFADGPGASALFHTPYGIAIDGSGNLYVADAMNNRIRKIAVATGVVSTFAGTGTEGLSNGAAASATFWYPGGLAFDSKGNLFVGELGNYTVREIATDGTVTTIAGTGSKGSADGPALSASFDQPIGLVVDANDNIYVADEVNNKIRKITAVTAVTPE